MVNIGAEIVPLTKRQSYFLRDLYAHGPAIYPKSHDRTTHALARRRMVTIDKDHVIRITRHGVQVFAAAQQEGFV